MDIDDKKRNMSKAGKRPGNPMHPVHKLFAIQRVSSGGESKASVARSIQVPESTLRGWCKNPDSIKKAAESIPDEELQKLFTENIHLKSVIDEIMERKRTPVTPQQQQLHQQLQQRLQQQLEQEQLLNSNMLQQRESNTGPKPEENQNSSPQPTSPVNLSSENQSDFNTGSHKNLELSQRKLKLNNENKMVREKTRAALADMSAEFGLDQFYSRLSKSVLKPEHLNRGLANMVSPTKKDNIPVSLPTNFATPKSSKPASGAAKTLPTTSTATPASYSKDLINGYANYLPTSSSLPSLSETTADDLLRYCSTRPNENIQKSIATRYFLYLYMQRLACLNAISGTTIPTNSLNSGQNGLKTTAASKVVNGVQSTTETVPATSSSKMKGLFSLPSATSTTNNLKPLHISSSPSKMNGLSTPNSSSENPFLQTNNWINNTSSGTNTLLSNGFSGTNTPLITPATSTHNTSNNFINSLSNSIDQTQSFWKGYCEVLPGTVPTSSDNSGNDKPILYNELTKASCGKLLDSLVNTSQSTVTTNTSTTGIGTISNGISSNGISSNDIASNGIDSNGTANISKDEQRKILIDNYLYPNNNYLIKYGSVGSSNDVNAMPVDVDMEINEENNASRYMCLSMAIKRGEQCIDYLKKAAGDSSVFFTQILQIQRALKSCKDGIDCKNGKLQSIQKAKQRRK